MRFQSLVLSCTALLCSGQSMAQVSRPSQSHRSLVQRQPDKRWSPAISAEITYYSGIAASPNKNAVFFSRFRGDLSCDCNIFELIVYKSNDIRSALKLAPSRSFALRPFRILTKRSSINFGYFVGANWVSDSKVGYVGLDANGNRQSFVYDIDTGTETALTSWPFGIGYDPKFFGDSLFATVDVPWKPSPAYPIHPLGEDDAKPIVSSDKDRVTFVGPLSGSPSRLSFIDPQAVSASPDNSGLLVAVGAIKMPDIPTSWAGYDGNVLNPTALAVASRIQQFKIVDAKKGTDAAFFDAPAGTATLMGRSAARSLPPRAFWAGDGRHIVMVNTAIPLSAGNPDAERTAYVVGYNIPTKEWSTIEPVKITERSGASLLISAVDWRPDLRSIAIRHARNGNPAETTYYRLEGDRWSRFLPSESAAALQTAPAVTPEEIDLHGIKVVLRQDANSPPEVIALDGRRKLILTRPDPVLAQVRRLPQVPFRWPLPDGGSNVGGLIMPDRADGSPPPLVIQAYSYDPERFKPDGPARHAYAGQALAARGIAVLNIDIDPDRFGKENELTHFVDSIDGAVTELYRRGLIDRNRVGLIGFSRAGFEAYYAITHPGRFTPAAAVLDDAFPGSYSYILAMQGLTGKSATDQYGGTFWNKKEDWLRTEPTFNVDRVRTPALFTMHNGPTALVLDTIGAFSANRRPLEFLMFPLGAHELVRPRERQSSQLATLDWMSFWLLRDRPSDERRAARWDAMKRAWDRQRAWEAAGNPAGSEPDSEFDSAAGE